MRASRRFPDPEPLEPAEDPPVDKETALTAIDKTIRVLDTVPADFDGILKNIEVQIQSASPMDTALSFFDPQQIGLGVKATAWSVYHELNILVDIAKNGETTSEQLAAMDRLRQILKDSIVTAGGVQTVHRRTDRTDADGTHVTTEQTAVALIQNVASNTRQALAPPRVLGREYTTSKENTHARTAENGGRSLPGGEEPQPGSTRPARSGRTIIGRDGKTYRIPSGRHRPKRKEAHRQEDQKEEEDLTADDVGGTLPKDYTTDANREAKTEDTTAIDQALGHRPPQLGDNPGICSEG